MRPAQSYGKTGLSFVGFSPNYVVTSWVVQGGGKRKGMPLGDGGGVIQGLAF